MVYILIAIIVICVSVILIIDRICEYLENREKSRKIGKKSTHEN